jgi:hypothetical protein
MLAQTRPGARGALLFHAAVPLSEFGGSWPQGAPVQIHFMEDDRWAEKDLPVAREIAETIEGAELFSSQATGTCSPTTACRTTSRIRPRCSSGACSASWNASSRIFIGGVSAFAVAAPLGGILRQGEDDCEA